MHQLLRQRVMPKTSVERSNGIQIYSLLDVSLIMSTQMYHEFRVSRVKLLNFKNNSNVFHCRKINLWMKVVVINYVFWKLNENLLIFNSGKNIRRARTLEFNLSLRPRFSRLRYMVNTSPITHNRNEILTFTWNQVFKCPSNLCVLFPTFHSLM